MSLLAYLTLLGLPEVLKGARLGRSTFYKQMAQGLWPQPIFVGPRAKAWIAGEIDAVKAARIAGHGDEQIRILVHQLFANRQSLPSLLQSLQQVGDGGQLQLPAMDGASPNTLLASKEGM